MSENGTLSEDRFARLVEQAINGNRDALGDILHHHSEHLRVFVTRRLPAWIRSTVDVDDVVQETFGIVVREITRFRPRSRASFVAWLRSIAASRVVDLTRAHARKKRGGDLHRVDLCRLVCGSMIDLLDVCGIDENTPFDDACRAEATARTGVAVAALPAAYRDVIQLRYFEDRNTAEIAEVLDRTHDAVAGLLKRSKEKLRKALGQASTYLGSC